MIHIVLSGEVDEGSTGVAGIYNSLKEATDSFPFELKDAVKSPNDECWTNGECFYSVETWELPTLTSPPPWDTTFMNLARVMSRRSKDRSSQIGAVIIGSRREIVSMGYNGMCRGIDDNVEERHERPEKYKWMEHAERNAVYNAASLGHKVLGCIIYVSGLLPCCDCARAIIQSGMVEVVVESWKSPERWLDNMKTSISMVFEAGVRVRCIDGTANPYV